MKYLLILLLLLSSCTISKKVEKYKLHRTETTTTIIDTFIRTKPLYLSDSIYLDRLMKGDTLTASKENINTMVYFSNGKIHVKTTKAQEAIKVKAKVVTTIKTKQKQVKKEVERFDYSVVILLLLIILIYKALK